MKPIKWVIFDFLFAIFNHIASDTTTEIFEVLALTQFSSIKSHPLNNASFLLFQTKGTAGSFNLTGAKRLKLMIISWVMIQFLMLAGQKQKQNAFPI